MVRREDVEALVDTVEILSTPETVQLILMSESDIEHGRIKEISSVDDLLRELELMVWTVKRTDTFLETFARVRSYKKIIAELGKKIQRLCEDPITVGGWLSGSLHGKKSTRIKKKTITG